MHNTHQITLSYCVKDYIYHKSQLFITYVAVEQVSVPQKAEFKQDNTYFSQFLAKKELGTHKPIASSYLTTAVNPKPFEIP